MSFSDCYVLMLAEKLNLMISESFQIDDDDIVECDTDKKLCMKILEGIMASKITSCHFTPSQAEAALDYLGVLDANKSIDDMKLNSGSHEILNKTEFEADL